MTVIKASSRKKCQHALARRAKWEGDQSDDKEGEPDRFADEAEGEADGQAETQRPKLIGDLEP
ncbi:MAG TPA: hypothetical protein VNV63_05255, partial [Nitrospiria bacterium]|nr:hypothetical protein [Nitrospiria bacterium]